MVLVPRRVSIYAALVEPFELVAKVLVPLEPVEDLLATRFGVRVPSLVAHGKREAGYVA